VVKDTTVFWDAKPYGTGVERYFNFAVKGKNSCEWQATWGI
jgi:hypothetical protein